MLYPESRGHCPVRVTGTRVNRCPAGTGVEMDHLPTVTRKDILRLVARDFPPGDQQTVRDLLDEYARAGMKDNVYRVQAAILKLSRGDVTRIQSWIEVARTDFRDVLAPAEYPELGKLGFVGVDRLDGSAREAVKARDWAQYSAWFGRR